MSDFPEQTPSEHTQPTTPDSPFFLLELLLRAYNAPANAAAWALHEARLRQDVPKAQLVLTHLGDMLGMAFVAAQVVLNEGKDRRPLRESAPLDGHPWLRQMEYIDALANFWKHKGEWKAADWDLVEKSEHAERKLAKGTAAAKTAVKLAGFGVTRSEGSRNVIRLAERIGFSDQGTWKWLITPIRNWYRDEP